MTAPTYRWQPTTAEIAARYGLRPDDVVRFDHNTSPFPTDWAPAVVAPMARHLNEYPGASYAPLRTAAALYYGTDPTHVVPGAGVDEIILLIAKAFLGPRSRACAVVPTYPLYEIATSQLGGEFVGVDWETPDFGLPRRAIGEAAETSDVTWLCLPNNPTGHRIGDGDLVDIIEAAKGIVVIDAAYAEFTDDRWAPWTSRFDNVIVCHTMSKGFGLAALRVGFALTNPDLAAHLDAIRPPGSISSMSVEIAEMALREPNRMRRHVSQIIRERSRFADDLAAVGLAVVPGSLTNFVLCHVGPHARDLAGSLMAEGLVVRTFPASGPLDGFLRFTVRSRAENDRLLDALRRHTP
jgi:histidinol-phosphate aminotransferase